MSPVNLARRRSPWAVWGVGLAVYVVAVFHRSSLGVAGLVAADRFGISAAQLATFTMLQLLVYAAMQVPVGLLVDRFGSRTVMLTGLALLTLGQTGFALSTTYLAALLSRGLVGVGDAMTFICLLRLVSSWFPARRVPLVTQLTAVSGQTGALVAAVPMTWALAHLGWTRSYLLAAGLGLVLAVALVVVLHDTPDGRNLRGERLTVRAVRQSLAASWEHPGTRLGFWMHFVTQFSTTTMSLLWGYPFLVRGEGQSSTSAGGLLSLMVVAVMLSGPALGMLVGRYPWQRSTMVLAITGAIVAVWTLVLAWPGPAPYALLVLLLVVTGIGGPASAIGFDLGRTSNPSHRLASATGIINQGGFYASLVLVVLIGLVLDWRTPGASTAYTPSAFVWAMSMQYPLWALGLLQVWRYRRIARRRVLADPEAMADLGLPH